MGTNLRKVLLAEDFDILRNLLTKFLEKNGFQVIQVSDGQKAIDAFNRESSSISLVISDILMPEQTGLDLLSVIRKTSDVPVMLITGNDECLNSKILENQKGVTAIKKPFKQSELLAAIEQILALRA